MKMGGFAVFFRPELSAFFLCYLLTYFVSLCVLVAMIVNFHVAFGGFYSRCWMLLKKLEFFYNVENGSGGEN